MAYSMSVEKMAMTFLKKRFLLPDWVAITIFVIFVAFWGFGLVSALSFGGCIKRPLTDPKKAAYCNISIVAGVFLDFDSLERAKRSSLFLNRGMVRVTEGDLHAGKRDFRRALLDAAGLQLNGQSALPPGLKSHFVAELFSAIQKRPAQDITTITWLEVVRELSCASPATASPELCVVP